MSAWRRTAYRAARPLLFAFDAEAIHHTTLDLLAASGRRLPALCRLASGVGTTDAARDPVEVIGLRFRNRVGLGAGFDKDGVAIEGWAALGFGFIELGTVTPRPQAGNPRPRLTRLPRDRALINRMGFNNAGAEALAERIHAARPRLPDGFVVGVNIGRNRDGDVDDYPTAARAVADVADYLAINVSSPNTPGLRDLEDPGRLHELLAMVREAAPAQPLDRQALAGPDPQPPRGHRPRSDRCRRAAWSSATRRRSGSACDPGRPMRPEASPAPRSARSPSGPSRRPVESVRIGWRSSPRVGLPPAADAAAAIEAGADLVQLWTGMIYTGPGLIGDAVRSC